MHLQDTRLRTRSGLWPRSHLTPSLGSGDTWSLSGLVRKLTLWGAITAAILGAVVVATSKWLPLLFGPSPEMHQIASRALVVAGVLMPISGVVFILDGVLIGAQESRYLAVAGVVTLIAYLPSLWALTHWIASAEPLSLSGQATALTWLWVAFAGWFMALRGIANWWRTFGPSRRRLVTRPTPA